MANFIKTKSSYVFRKEHQRTKDGAIYERDFATISAPDNPTDGSFSVYNDGIFKFVTRVGKNGQKKHRGGKIIKSPCNNDYWFGNCLTGTTSKQSKIIFNPDYTSIRDFAYYGSAVDLVRGSLTDIIDKFPAEIYFTNDTNETDTTFSGYYKVENDFGIDIVSVSVGSESVENPLKYFCESKDCYEVIFSSGTKADLTWSVQTQTGTCEELVNGKFIATATTNAGVIYVYLKNGVYSYYTNTSSNSGNRIRPKQDYIDEFYDNLDDFEKILINNTTNPLYRAVFSTPQETNTGNIKRNKVYIWPNKHGYNPDITSVNYENYVDDLLSLASYHDEYDSDILWRRMTHESIKKLDWTFTRHNGIGIEEDIDTSRINPILHLYGRQYDDIKRYIDNIKYFNNITYNKKNNVPDYFLPNVLSMSGWDVKSVNPSKDNVVVGDNHYSGIMKNPTSVDVNTEFLRRLKLNSRYLLQKKGTRDGIKSMLGLFGFKSSDYSIKEYYNMFSGTYPDYTAITYYNSLKSNYPTDDSDDLYGLALREVVKGTKDYVIPWYDPDWDYDRELYFQMHGGWEKTDIKYVNMPDLTTVTALTGISIYGETNNTLKFASRFDEMLELGRYRVKTGDICYVVDISDVSERYGFKGTEPTWENFSHYFLLKDVNYSSTLGRVDDGEEDDDYIDDTEEDDEDMLYSTSNSNEEHYGWINISTAEITGGTSDNGKKVIYLESIVDDNSGNNPHVTDRYFYDDGQEYIKRLKQPFKGAYDAGYLEGLSETDRNYMTGITYTSSTVEDNKKCWYFTDTDLTNSIKKVTWNTNKYVTDGDCGDVKIVPSIYNPETNTTITNNKADEAAANSVVNVKNMVITFNNVQGNKVAIEYIMNTVMFYVKQMIPSTTIFEVKFA